MRLPFSLARYYEGSQESKTGRWTEDFESGWQRDNAEYSGAEWATRAYPNKNNLVGGNKREKASVPDLFSSQDHEIINGDATAGLMYFSRLGKRWILANGKRNRQQEKK